MAADLDMNSHRILNLSAGLSANEPATIAQLQAGVSSVGAAPATSNYVTMSAEANLTNERVLTAGSGVSITDAGAGSTVTVALATIPAHTYVGNNTGSTAAPANITNTQLTADLNAFTSSLKGLAPASGGGTTNFLRADGSWATVSGGEPIFNRANLGGL
jgi:hypothetical protein